MSQAKRKKAKFRVGQVVRIGVADYGKIDFIEANEMDSFDYHFSCLRAWYLEENLSKLTARERGGR